ncbi:MFS transporter [Pseudonocardia lutea]|uniref:MFS transporter n=1 Tax=Pseudonocardia lutea TaxID=2172015 RepID=A0ABW1I189_9PSEU
MADTSPSPGSTGKRLDRRAVGPAVVIGSALEWFDFYLYASMAALVFGPVFFPGESSVAGTLASIATFAVGFLVRPLGGIVFGHLGDRIGRKKVLSLTFLLMGVSSGLIGLIPSYASIGVFAPVLLVLLRLTQGLGAGAEFGSAVAVAYEHAGVRTRGRLGSWPALGVNIGLFVSSLTVTVLTTTNREFLLTWGWRIPFIASFALVVLGIWVRARMPETPAFEAVRQCGAGDRRAPLRTLLARDWRGLLVVAMVTVGYLGSSYLFKTFSLSYLTEFRGVAAGVGALGVTLASAVAIVTVPIAGRLCDRFDSRQVQVAGAAGIAALAFPFFWALDTGAPWLIWAVLILGTGVIMPAMLAASGSFYAGQFPAEVRASGLGTGRETGGIAGGLAPLLAFALVAVMPGNATWGVSILFLAFAVLVVVGTFWDQRSRVEDRERARGLPAAEPVTPVTAERGSDAG